MNALWNYGCTLINYCYEIINDNIELLNKVLRCGLTNNDCPKQIKSIYDLFEFIDDDEIIV